MWGRKWRKFQNFRNPEIELTLSTCSIFDTEFKSVDQFLRRSYVAVIRSINRAWCMRGEESRGKIFMKDHSRNMIRNCFEKLSNLGPIPKQKVLERNFCPKTDMTHSMEKCSKLENSKTTHSASIFRVEFKVTIQSVARIHTCMLKILDTLAKNGL